MEFPEQRKEELFVVRVVREGKRSWSVRHWPSKPELSMVLEILRLLEQQVPAQVDVGVFLFAVRV